MPTQDELDKATAIKLAAKRRNKLTEIRAIESDAQLVAHLIGAMESELAFANLHTYKRGFSNDSNIYDYFNSVVHPSNNLQVDRTTCMAVIRERLDDDYGAHPELHRAAEILEKTTEYPEGNRWDGYTPEETLKMLKHWEKPPSLKQRIKGVFRPNS